MAPPAIDAELSRIWQGEQRAVASLVYARRRLGAEAGRGQAGLARVEAEAAAHQAVLDALRAEAAPYEAEFARRGGWARYFLVTNVAGHVHRGTSCASCYPTTTYAWLVELAGCDEVAMVAEWGERACTVCFPDAPTHPGFADGTSAWARRSQGERDARDEAKAERAAERAAKAIVAPDGRPLRVGGYVVATKVAAQRELSGAVQSYGWYGPGHPSDFAAQIEALSEALAAVGIEAAPIIARAAKKVAREGGTFVWAPAQ